jgi:V/A-type H+-transporting ATPase subunit D
MSLRLTKNELKRQKDNLARFQRYLPMLQLKKRQLQAEVQRIQREQTAVAKERDALLARMQPWLAVLGAGGIDAYLDIDTCDMPTENIAGVSFPVFGELRFAEPPRDLFATPPWIDPAIASMRVLLSLDLKLRILDTQHSRIDAELRSTSQRVNLFERVRIPQAREHIRRIRIYLGDLQTAAVVRGKLAKRKREVAS